MELHFLNCTVSIMTEGELFDDEPDGEILEVLRENTEKLEADSKLYRRFAAVMDESREILEAQDRTITAFEDLVARFESRDFDPDDPAPSYLEMGRKAIEDYRAERKRISELGEDVAPAWETVPEFAGSHSPEAETVSDFAGMNPDDKPAGGIPGLEPLPPLAGSTGSVRQPIEDLPEWEPHATDLNGVHLSGEEHRILIRMERESPTGPFMGTPGAPHQIHFLVLLEGLRRDVTMQSVPSAVAIARSRSRLLNFDLWRASRDA